jgi:hypothetical protein
MNITHKKGDYMTSKNDIQSIFLGLAASWYGLGEKEVAGSSSWKVKALLVRKVVSKRYGNNENF